jgi:hypothetical protein
MPVRPATARVPAEIAAGAGNGATAGAATEVAAARELNQAC